MVKDSISIPVMSEFHSSDRKGYGILPPFLQLCPKYWHNAPFADYLQFDLIKTLNPKSYHYILFSTATLT